MKFRVTIEGIAHEVGVQSMPDGRFEVALDGAACDADVVAVPGGLSLRLGGKVFDVVLGGTAAARTVTAGHRRTVAQIESGAEPASGSRPSLPPQSKELRAPMPGQVVKVCVAVGDAVDADDPLVVIEAMKMENELRATMDGSVAAIEVSAGDNVDAGDLLVSLG